MRFFVSITACLVYSLDMILSPFPSFKLVEYEIILEMCWGFLFVCFYFILFALGKGRAFKLGLLFPNISKYIEVLVVTLSQMFSYFKWSRYTI